MNNEINGKTLLSVTASIAAAIIPDTPIVSIAGATLSSEITTTTTSTTTTPTPTPMPTSFISSTKANKDSIANSSNNPMSDAAAIKSAGGNGNTTANAAATNTPADAGCNAGKSSFTDHTTNLNAANAGKTDEATTIDTKKSDVSDLEEPDLKKLLEEAYTYKTPKDKKDKSEIFLDLLQKVENEDLGITSTRSDSHRHHPHSQSRHQQKQGGSLQDLLQLPSDFRRQNHTSRHKKNSSVSSRQREGGSLPSNVNVANCLLNSFEQQASVYARRAFLVGVEPGTVTLNSGNNNALVGVGVSGGTNASVGAGIITGCSAIANSTNLSNKESGNTVGANVTSVGGVAGGGNMATTATGHNVGSTMAAGTGIINTAINTANSIKSTGDYIINIGDMIDIQQQQQILPSKAQDGGQGLPFYERVDIDMRIPRPSLHRGGDVEYAPARSHHYVDEVIRFHQIDSSESSLCESGEVAISVNTLGNTLKSAAASCSLPMPLDERYRSLKSVMGEKGDSAGVNVNSALAAKNSGTTMPNNGNSNSITNSNTSGVGGGSSSSIGIGNYAKSLPLSRQTDENGNDCERQQHSSNNIITSAGQSQAKAKGKKKPQKDNTIPVDVENEAGYRGKDPVEVLVKFIESTEEDNKQSGSGNSNKFSENSKKKERKKEKVKQNKMKKSNSLEELRSCAKIDVGELKQSAATTENNSVTMRGKGNGGGGGNKGSKNNSASTADINKNFDGGTKETVATTANSGGKQVNTVYVAPSGAATMNNRKGERRSWGTEELQYLGTDGSVAGLASASLVSSVDEKFKERKEKRSKDKEKEKDRGERDVEKVINKEKEKEKDSDKHDKFLSNKAEGNTKSERHDKNERLEKTDKQEKQQEKLEKVEKLEKRKKSENIMQATVTPIKSTPSNLDHQGNSTPVISAIDLLSMNTLISETAEFHVVTKKKKPKKQRASIDDTHFTTGSNYNNNYNYNNNNNNSNNSGITGGFQRGGQNTQKGANNNANNNGSGYGNQQQQQQQQSRYKHYNNNAHGFNNNYGNSNSNNNNNNNSGDGGRLDYHNNYNSNYNNNYNTNNNNNNNYSHQQYGHQQQSQYHQHHQNQQQQHQQHQHQNQHQHVNAHNTSTSSTDKSRRKSTSSVPPSEKSDSSDIDSVHSLPIESTAASTTKSKQQQQQQRHKPASSTTTTPETPKSSTSSGSPGSAPISYAHIAASAAVDRWPIIDAPTINKDGNANTAANGNVALNVSSSSTAETQSQQPQQQQNITNAETASASLSNANSTVATASAHSSTVNAPAKVSKTKKQASKPDFPELVATITDVSKSTAAAVAGVGALKIISYSQSLVAAPAQVNTAANIVNAAGTASMEKVAITTVEVVNMLPATVQDVSKIDNAINVSPATRLPQQQPPQNQHQQTQQQQTLQKSKSVENDSYSFNSSNLDQQYPALEKTVKRHSTTNVSVTATTPVIPPTAVAGPTGGGSSSALIAPALASAAVTSTNTVSSGKFNFAAAAKQLPTNKNVIGSQPTVPTTPLNTQDTQASQLPNPTAPLTTSSTNSSIVTAAPLPLPLGASNTTLVNPTTVSVAAPPSAATTARKSKEKSPTAVYAPVQLPTNIVAPISAQPATATNVSSRVSDAINTTRKNKKDKVSHQLLPTETASVLAISGEQLTNTAQKSSTATQTHTSSMDAIVPGSKSARSQLAFVAGSEKIVTTQTVGKTQRLQTSSNTITSGRINAAPSGTTTTTSNAVIANRPAVIILNDDRSGDSSIEFTFGDFDEDELKFFDDNITEDECTDPAAYDEANLQEPKSHERQSSTDANKVTKSINPAILTNDSESVPSFAIKPQLPMTKEDDCKRKICATDEKILSNSTDMETSANYNENIKEEDVAATPDTTEKSQQHSQQSRRNSETPQLQQLETCNEIETAIIAAARAAAEQPNPQPMQPQSLPQQHQQQPRPYRHKHQPQQQQYRSTTYGNAYEPPTQRTDHRSQSSYTRDTANHYQPQQHHYHNQYHQHQHQQQHYHYHQSSSSNSASRSRSSSSNNNANSFDAAVSSPPTQRSPNPSPAVVVNIQRKEFDIHFIPPTMSSAQSALQHNEIIVDFIGSAWEEVSKVTKFYEGQ